MRVLVIGNGAREHALLWKLQQSPRVSDLFITPGNAGMAKLATYITPSDHEKTSPVVYAEIAEKYLIDLTVVGPEALLVDGLVDEFQARNLRVFGPTADAARLEGSKIWAKDLMQRVGIPTAISRPFNDVGAARVHAKELDWRCVVKADGLAQGKGSFVCTSRREVNLALKLLLTDHHYGRKPVIVEELLEGQEVSVFAISDGKTVRAFGAAQDHKRLLDRDEGPNTGGMGAYSPVEHMHVAQDFAASFFEPVIEELSARGMPYTGFLYAGAIVTDQGPKILEFNCRLGDPEAQVLLSRLDEDLADILWKATDTELIQVPTDLRWRKEEALCVVVASKGYPAEGDVGTPISGVADAEAVDGVLVFHSGTLEDPVTKKLVTNGGRILSVTGVGRTLEEARSRAYEAVERINFAGKRFRTDIGTKAIGTVWRSEWRKPPRWEESVVESSRAIGRVADDLDQLAAERVPEESERLRQLRDRLYEILIMLNASGRASEPSDSPQLSELTSAFDELLEKMQRPGAMEGVDAVFHRTNRVRIPSLRPSEDTPSEEDDALQEL